MQTILVTEWKKELTCWACLTDLNWPQPSPISNGEIVNEKSYRDWSRHGYISNMATGGHFGFWLLTNSAAILARVMGAKFFSKYLKELKSSVKPYYAFSGQGTPRLHPTKNMIMV